MDKVKSWMVAWSAAVLHGKTWSHILPVIAVPVLLCIGISFSPTLTHPKDQAIIVSKQHCPCPLLDGIATLEHKLQDIISNITNADQPYQQSRIISAGGASMQCSDAPASLAIHGQRSLSIANNVDSCLYLAGDLQTTNELIHNLVGVASVCTADGNQTVAWHNMVGGAALATSLFLLCIAAVGGKLKCLPSPKLEGSSFLDGVLQLYHIGTSRFAEVCGQDPACVDRAHGLKDMLLERSRLAAVAAELARLREEVGDLSLAEETVARLKEERDRLQAAAAVVEGLEQQNAELSKTAYQLDSVTALNAELRSTVNKVLELRTQNQQLQPIASLLDSVSSKHEQLQQAASQVLDLQNQNQQLQATANLYDSVKTTNVNLQQMVAQVVELEAQNQQLRGTAALLDLVKAANTELLEAAAQVHELQAQNQQLQSTASMLDQARAVNNKLREMVLQVQELQVQNRQLQASASFLHSVKALNNELQDRVIHVQRLQRGTFATSPGPKDLLVLRDQEARSSAPQTPTSLITSPRSLESDGGRNRVFIGGLAATVDEQSLAGCFDRYGTVIAAKVVRSAKGQQSRGYGFVTFQLPEHADSAVDAVKEMMALLKPKESGLYERLTIDYSTSSHLD